MYGGKTPWKCYILWYHFKITKVEGKYYFMGSIFVKYSKLQWMPINGITLGQTVTDPINRMITITENTSFTKYAIARHLRLFQSRSVWLTQRTVKHEIV